MSDDFCGCFFVGEGFETFVLLELAYFAAADGEDLDGSPCTFGAGGEGSAVEICFALF